LDETSIRAANSFLGAGGIMVFDDTRNMVDAARDAMEFFKDESCGKCFPCRIGTTRLFERLVGSGELDQQSWSSEVEEIGTVMKATSACGLGMAAPLITESLMRHFPETVSRFLTDNSTR
jgi:NADH:ubiquinone oxidoreductase subunit F (NADH-binding)